MSKEYCTMKDGTVICYNDFGSGRPVILLHGWTGHKESMNPLGEAIANAGYRVIVPDLRSSGETTESHTRPVTMHIQADDVHELIEKVGLEDVTIIGHSMGGMETVDYIARIGDEHIRSVGMLDPNLCICCKEDWAYANRMNQYTYRMGVQDYESMLTDLVSYLTMMYENGIVAAAPEGEDRHEAALRKAREHCKGLRDKEVAELHLSMCNYDGREDLKKMSVPFLHIYCRNSVNHLPGLWDFYRETLAACGCDYTEVGFETSNHGFFEDPAWLPKTIEVVLEFLKK